MVAVSSCITGVRCRYNASHTYNQSLMDSIHCEYISLCPELMAGFDSPRPSCEIVGGTGEDVLNGNAQIIDCFGTDITAQMLHGAQKALTHCFKNGVTTAYLQAKSPTCGCGKIYNGSFSKTLKPGNGIFTALLLQNGVEVIEVEQDTSTLLV